MVGTYKIGEREVSEAEFKKARYGEDSRAYKSAVERESQARENLASAGRKGSDYSVVTRRDGSKEVYDERTGKQVSTDAYEAAKQQESESKKGRIIMAEGKDSRGLTTYTNVSDYFNEAQKKEFSDLTTKKGRLTIDELKRAEQVNQQGNKVMTSSVKFSYKERAPEQKILMSEKKEDIKESTKTNKNIAVWGAREKQKGISGAMSWLETEERKALERQRSNEIKQKSTFENLIVLPALAVGKAGVGILQLGESLVKGVANPKKTFESGKKVVLSVVENPALLYQVPASAVQGVGDQFKRNPLGTTVELAVGYGIIKGLSVGVKAGAKVVNAPKIVGQTQGATISNTLDDVTRSATKTQTKVKAGKSTFRVDATTQTINKADDVSTRLQSSSSDISISKLNKKGAVKNTNTGFARSETVLSKTSEGQIIARGDTVQATNTMRGSVIRQGDIVSAGQSGKDSYVLTNVVRTGRGVKSASVSGADDLKFVADKSKRLSSIESSGAKKVTEIDAPLTQTISTPQGNIQITDSAKKVTQTLYDDFGSARGGRYLTRADKATKIGVDPYTNTVSVDGVSVSVKPSQAGASNIFKRADVSKSSISSSSSSAPSQVSSVVQQAKSIEPVTTQSSQALTAVRDVVNTRVGARVDVVASPSAVVTGGVVVTKASSEQSTRVESPKQVSEPIQSTTTTQIPVVSTDRVLKTFTSTETLPKEKVDLSSVSGSKSSSRRSTVQKSFTDTIINEKIEQKQTPIIKLTQKQTPIPRTTSASTIKSILSGTLITPKQQQTSQKRSQGFGVFVRERGLFKQVGSSSFSKQGAQDLGAFTVSNTPRATFMLRPSSLPISSAPRAARGYFSRVRSKFTKKNDLFIEKKEERISTKGELAGITRLGILANKNKNVFGKVKL